MPIQDTGSRSAIVRFYYKRRLFMGFCCVCCELLYLALFLLHFPEYRAWPLVPIQAPAVLHINGEEAVLCPASQVDSSQCSRPPCRGGRHLLWLLLSLAVV